MKKNKKLLLLCQHFYPELISTGILMTEMCEALTGLGWDITVYSAQPSLILDGENEQVPNNIDYKGIKIIRVSSWGSHGKRLIHRLLFALSYLASTAWLVLRTAGEFDVIAVTTNPPFIGALGRLAKIIHKKPYVLILHDIYPDITIKLGVLKVGSPVARIWEAITRLIMRGAGANVALGRDMAEVVRRKLGEDAAKTRVEMIPNWSDEKNIFPVPKEGSEFAARHNLNGSFVVQYAGRIGRTHNLEPLLGAADLLRDRPVVFQFIGDGAKKKKLSEIAAAKGLTNVQFLPYEPISKMADVLSAADLPVVCLEGFYTGLSVPNKVYGIMAAGKPVVAFMDMESEIALMVRENECGIILPDPTAEQVSRVITDLMDDPSKLRQMGENSGKAFLNQYTLSIAAKRYDLLMREVCDPVLSS